MGRYAAVLVHPPTGDPGHARELLDAKCLGKPDKQPDSKISKGCAQTSLQNRYPNDQQAFEKMVPSEASGGMRIKTAVSYHLTSVG